MELVNTDSLMIGDWVLVNGTPMQIQAVNDIDGEIMAGDELYCLIEDRVHSEDKIEPIPLTAEILEKNGFECEQMEFWRAVWNTYKIALNLYIAICGDMRLCGYYVTQRNDSDYIHDMFKIDYVHQLQHILKDCRIDKEIVL